MKAVARRVVELVPLCSIEQPTEHPRLQRQIGMTDMRGGHPEHQRNTHYLGTGTQEGQRHCGAQVEPQKFQRMGAIRTSNAHFGDVVVSGMDSP